MSDLEARLEYLLRFTNFSPADHETFREAADTLRRYREALIRIRDAGEWAAAGYLRSAARTALESRNDP